MTRKSFLGAAAFATVLAAGTLAAEAGYLTTDDTDLRAGPGNHYAYLGEIDSGSSVRVYGCSGDWCHIAYSGRVGYIDSDDLMRARAGVLYRVPNREAPGLSGISDALFDD